MILSFCLFVEIFNSRPTTIYIADFGSILLTFCAHRLDYGIKIDPNIDNEFHIQQLYAIYHNLKRNLFIINFKSDIEFNLNHIKLQYFTVVKRALYDLRTVAHSFYNKYLCRSCFFYLNNLLQKAILLSFIYTAATWSSWPNKHLSLNEMHAITLRCFPLEIRNTDNIKMFVHVLRWLNKCITIVWIVSHYCHHSTCKPLENLFFPSKARKCKKTDKNEESEP